MCTALRGYPTPGTYILYIIIIIIPGGPGLDPWGIKNPVFYPTLKHIYTHNVFLTDTLRIDLDTSAERASLPKFENMQILRFSAFRKHIFPYISPIFGCEPSQGNPFPI